MGDPRSCGALRLPSGCILKLAHSHRFQGAAETGKDALCWQAAQPRKLFAKELTRKRYLT